MPCSNAELKELKEPARAQHCASRQALGHADPGPDQAVATTGLHTLEAPSTNHWNACHATNHKPTLVSETAMASLRTCPDSCFTMRWMNCGDGQGGRMVWLPISSVRGRGTAATWSRQLSSGHWSAVDALPSGQQKGWQTRHSTDASCRKQLACIRGADGLGQLRQALTWCGEQNTSTCASLRGDRQAGGTATVTA